MPSQDKTGFKFSKAILDGDMILKVSKSTTTFGSTKLGFNTGEDRWRYRFRTFLYQITASKA